MTKTEILKEKITKQIWSDHYGGVYGKQPYQTDTEHCDETVAQLLTILKESGLKFVPSEFVLPKLFKAGHGQSETAFDNAKIVTKDVILSQIEEIELGGK